MISDIDVENIIEYSSNKKIFFVYTIFNRPFDYPNDIVSRVFEVETGKVTATNKIKKFKDIRECFLYFEGHKLTFVYPDKTDPFNMFGSFI